MALLISFVFFMFGFGCVIFYADMYHEGKMNPDRFWWLPFAQGILVVFAAMFFTLSSKIRPEIF